MHGAANFDAAVRIDRLGLDGFLRIAMPTNPYAPPKSIVGDSALVAPRTVRLATKKARLANFFLDMVFALIWTVLTTVILALTGLGGWIEGMDWIEERLFGTVLWLTYYLSLEAAFGWTFAKLITGTRVVDENGGRPRFMKILGRSLARFVPFEPFSFLGDEPVGWHDAWSATRVVSLRQKSGPTLEDSFMPGFGDESRRI